MRPDDKRARVYRLYEGLPVNIDRWGTGRLLLWVVAWYTLPFLRDWLARKGTDHA
jgi:hypothetical protein